MSLKDCLAKGGGRRAGSVGNVWLTYNGDAGRKEGGSCHGARGGRDRWCCVVRAMMQQQRRQRQQQQQQQQQQKHGRGRAPGVCVEKRLWALERPDRGRLELRQTSIDPPPFDHPGWHRCPPVQLLYMLLLLMAPFEPRGVDGASFGRRRDKAERYTASSSHGRLGHVHVCAAAFCADACTSERARYDTSMLPSASSSGPCRYV